MCPVHPLDDRVDGRGVEVDHAVCTGDWRVPLVPRVHGGFVHGHVREFGVRNEVHFPDVEPALEAVTSLAEVLE